MAGLSMGFIAHLTVAKLPDDPVKQTDLSSEGGPGLGLQAFTWGWTHSARRLLLHQNSVQCHVQHV